ncbi:hypothetical protein [Nocardioides sp. Leaf285]|uniref:hypothetical protein n=1 Tax=Nocardioides sp. Leaf285 TaxID=1736322 RepID=UPI0007036E51|nr:hypothetical protein [Nocardioides sp. Leaf285]KQP63739.1 hypothetical protein ASF47_17270 [Nocardioides sp. Leaf285]
MTAAALLPPGLRDRVEAAIDSSALALGQFVRNNLEVRTFGRPQLPLAVKWVASEYAHDYMSVNNGLYIGSNNYTWGQGVYVTGISEPISTAMYGRAGVVARFDPSAWRCFDARTMTNQRIYLRWLKAQPNYSEALLTVHSGHWLQILRNHFREQFKIDVVLFRPDEYDTPGWYTDPQHTWLAVSDWTPFGTLAEKWSQRFVDARLAAVAEEDFRADPGVLTRSPNLTLSAASPHHGGLATAVKMAYSNGTVLRIPS